MEEKKKPSTYMFEDLIITGSLFSIYSSMGPEPIVFYPIPPTTVPYKLKNVIESKHISNNFNKTTLLQIAVKSVSLLLSDYSFSENNENDLRNIKLFGILPYPDMKSVALTYFTYYYAEDKGFYLPCTYSLLVKEIKRSFLYDNIERLKPEIIKFIDDLLVFLKEKSLYSESKAQKYWLDIIPKFTKLYHDIGAIQKMPLSPITKKRRIKILFTGLENTGKTSFLLSLNRRFSKLVNLRPTNNLVKEPLNFLGTSIVKWDIPGQPELRDNILKKTELYLFEADLLYYFIDVQKPRIEESTQFLKQIKSHLDTFNEETPIIFIITKKDEDLVENIEIRRTIDQIRSIYSTIMGKHPFAFFETSIFSIFTILNAFSYGIRQLSPNHEFILHILDIFLKQNKLISILLMNEEGIVLGAKDAEDPEYNEILSRKQIFEVTASHFTSINKQFTKLDGEDNPLSKFYLSTSDLVFLHKFRIEDFIFFLLIYTKKPEMENEILKKVPDLEIQLKNLLRHYC